MHVIYKCECERKYCWIDNDRSEDGKPCKQNPNQNLEYYIGDHCGCCY